MKNPSQDRQRNANQYVHIGGHLSPLCRADIVITYAAILGIIGERTSVGTSYAMLPTNPRLLVPLLPKRATRQMPTA